MKEGYTHIAIVLDKSASMDSLTSSTIEGFNSFLKAQKEVEGEATMTLVQFADRSDTLMDVQPIVNADELSARNYRADGNSTALLDALGRTMNNTEHQLSEMDEDQKPEKVIFVVITDGAENSSQEFEQKIIMEMINRHRDDSKWEFVFIGANQDAIQAGGSMGMRQGSSLSYAQSRVGTKAMYCSLSKGMTSYRRKGVVAASSDNFFSEEDREVQDDLLNQDHEDTGILKDRYINLNTDTKSENKDDDSDVEVK